MLPAGHGYLLRAKLASKNSSGACPSVVSLAVCVMFMLQAGLEDADRAKRAHRTVMETGSVARVGAVAPVLLAAVTVT